METQKGQLTKTAVVAVGISTFLILIVILQHNLAFQNKGTIVLPAGGTYLGPPSPSPTLEPTAAAVEPAAANKDGLQTIKGRKYPYSFEIPASVKLVTFPGDAFDIYALSINNQPPENNVLIGVDDLSRTDELKKYIKRNKRAYVENWWKQFGGLKGVAGITEFTNRSGLKGYKAKFTNAGGASPNEDVFFASPDGGHVIHLANGPLEKAVFDAVVESVAWEKK